MAYFREEYTCDICGALLATVRIDGRTRFGPWADMCVGCHARVGVGLGTGKGQKFDVETGEKLAG